MKIAVFGGTFDPVTTEHVNIAKAAVKALSLDRLYVMPTFISPHKSSEAAPAKARLKMLKTAFKGQNKICISDFEIKGKSKSFTFITAEHFRKKFKTAEIYFLIGTDMLVDFKTWKFPERITAAADIAVFEREGFFADYEKEKEYFTQNFGKTFIILPVLGKDVSSSEIRTYISLGLPPCGIDERVLKIINKRGLYAGDEYSEYVKTHLPEKRLIHTANVVACALKKAKELNLSADKVRIAATLHDCAKYNEPSEFKGFALTEEMPDSVKHQFLGAFVAEKVLGIEDPEILDAIRYHTSGRANMTTLGKLIFVADMVEKGRTYEGVKELRALYERDFENCFLQCLKEEYLHLQNKKADIYYQTINAYNYYISGDN